MASLWGGELYGELYFLGIPDVYRDGCSVLCSWLQPVHGIR